MAIIFVFLYFLIYMTNRGIKKIKRIFRKKKKKMPKLPNKSLALIISAITSVIASNSLVQNIILGMSNVSFGKTESIFGLDIGYYFFKTTNRPTFNICFLVNNRANIIHGIILYNSI